MPDSSRRDPAPAPANPSWWRRLGIVVRWEGLRGLLRRILRRIFFPFVRVRRLHFFIHDLSRPMPKLEARVPLEMRVGTPDDVERFAADLQELGVPIAEARRRLAAGDVPAMGLVHGRLVNVCWMSFSSPWIDEIGMWLDLQPGECCGYQTVTHPDWRGQGIQPVASVFRATYKRSRGYSRHVLWVWADNIQNIASQSRRGRTLVRTVWTVWTIGMRRPVTLGARGAGSPVLVRPSAARPAPPGWDVTADGTGAER